MWKVRTSPLSSDGRRGKYDRLPGLAAELVNLKVDIIVASAPPAIQAAKQATGTIPIVMAISLIPWRLASSPASRALSGNITGLSAMAPELVGKQLELLKELVPKVSRVALLGNPANPGTAPMVQQRAQMRPGNWAYGFNPWRHGVLATSTAPLQR